MKIQLTSVLLALSASAQAAEPAAPAVRIVPETGTVLVNQGERYITAEPGQALSAGDQVMVLAGGAAKLEYADGCVLAVPGDSRVVVPVGEACARGVLEAKPGFLTIAGVGIGGPSAGAAPAAGSAPANPLAASFQGKGQITIDPNATDVCTDELSVSSLSPSKSCRQSPDQRCTVESAPYGGKTLDCYQGYSSSYAPPYRPLTTFGLAAGAVVAVVAATKNGEERQVSD